MNPSEEKDKYDGNENYEKDVEQQLADVNTLNIF